MKKSSTLISVFLLFFLGFFDHPVFALKKAYVVYMGAQNHKLGTASTLDYELAAKSHHNLLSTYSTEGNAEESLIYSYTKQINGFAANLDEQEAINIAKDPGVVSVFPNKIMKLHTTRTWEFMGLEKNGRVVDGSIWDKARFGDDVIIGNLDTGVWPESQSFNDHGYGPVPARWKGICQNQTAVRCNRKLIGMRYYASGVDVPVDPSQLSPRDFEGHGTHTLSTAGGSFVHNASTFGYANGTAKGGSPRARVAGYKVCWPDYGCSDIDILAAFDQAIDDGVDVLSVSLGGSSDDYFAHSISIGSFHAVKKGITVVCSAGNAGPVPSSVVNVAPWILTVGASTLDRSIRAAVKLGNGKNFTGQSLSVERLPEKLYPLIDAAKAYNRSSNSSSSTFCQEGTLDPVKVKGKVVVCLRGINGRIAKGLIVKKAGGIGMILVNDEANANSLGDDPHYLPAAHITYTDGIALYKYINSTKNPTAYIAAPTTKYGVKPSPFVASLSSRGPNTIDEDILKPDITAPGINVLAAFTKAVSPTEIKDDKRRVDFTMMSGTSMSCPHVSGIVGLLKAAHPDWSPAAIRSAIMTTARTRDNTMQPIKDSSFKKATPLDYGAGHVRPNRAMDPGLVYDLTIKDYLLFLCGTGRYNSTLLATFTAGMAFECPAKAPSTLDLNYPSIAVPRLNKTTIVSRTLKNVRRHGGIYKVSVKQPYGAEISVHPSSLIFHKFGEEKTFKVTISPKKGVNKRGYSFGDIAWSDGVRVVRSPVAISR